MNLTDEQIDDMIGFAIKMIPNPIRINKGWIFFGEDNGDYHFLIGNNQCKVSENTFFTIKFSDKKIDGICEYSDREIELLKEWIDNYKSYLLSFEE